MYKLKTMATRLVLTSFLVPIIYDQVMGMQYEITTPRQHFNADHFVRKLDLNNVVKILAAYGGQTEAFNKILAPDYQGTLNPTNITVSSGLSLITAAQSLVASVQSIGGGTGVTARQVATQYQDLLNTLMGIFDGSNGGGGGSTGLTSNVQEILEMLGDDILSNLTNDQGISLIKTKIQEIGTILGYGYYNGYWNRTFNTQNVAFPELCTYLWQILGTLKDNLLGAQNDSMKIIEVVDFLISRLPATSGSSPQSLHNALNDTTKIIDVNSARTDGTPFNMDAALTNLLSGVGLLKNTGGVSQVSIGYITGHSPLVATNIDGTSIPTINPPTDLRNAMQIAKAQIVINTIMASIASQGLNIVPQIDSEFNIKTLVTGVELTSTLEGTITNTETNEVSLKLKTAPQVSNLWDSFFSTQDFVPIQTIFNNLTDVKTNGGAALKAKSLYQVINEAYNYTVPNTGA